MLISFFLLLSHSPLLWKAHLYPLKCHETMSAAVWTSSALPACFPRCSSPHLAGPKELNPVLHCLALRTPKVDVVSNKCWVGGDRHCPGLCSYIQNVIGPLCSQDWFPAHVIFTAQQDPQGLSQRATLQEVGCISSREILSQGQDFAHVLTEFHKLPIHPACASRSGWQPSPRANWQLACLAHL